MYKETQAGTLGVLRGFCFGLSLTALFYIA